MFIFEDTLFTLSLIGWCRAVIPVAALIFMCIMLIVVPQQWQSNNRAQINKALKPGTRITTIHGLAGNVCSVSENFIIMQLHDGRKIEIIRNTVASVSHEKT